VCIYRGVNTKDDFSTFGGGLTPLRRKRVRIPTSIIIIIIIITHSRCELHQIPTAATGAIINISILQIPQAHFSVCTLLYTIILFAGPRIRRPSSTQHALRSYCIITVCVFVIVICIGVILVRYKLYK
jgi:hypothetical protein